MINFRVIRGISLAIFATLAALIAAALVSPSVGAQVSNDATLSGLTVSPKAIIGFDSDRTTYEVGVASSVAQASISATANDPAATVTYSPTDADDNTDGYQVNLSAGRNEVTVTVTSADTTTIKPYRVRVNRGVTDARGWQAGADLDGLIAAGNDSPYGIWSNGTTAWVADWTDDKVYAYQLSDGMWDADRDITLANANSQPGYIWSDGTTAWVADFNDDKLYAYQLSNGTRDADRDFDTLAAAGNNDPRGIWSDGETLWVADVDDDKLYAYQLSDGMRDADQDFDTLVAAGNNDPAGMWSDGTTLWVADFSDDKVYAYQLSDGMRDADQDFDTLAAAGNNSPRDIWSDGTTLWVVDGSDDKVYAYNMPPAPPSTDDATLSGLTVSPRNIIGFTAERGNYKVGVASTVTQATITATANDPAATVAYSPTDADDNTDGYQVNLSAGRNEVTVTVTSADTTDTKTYRVHVNQGVTDFYGWKAVLDLDGLIAADNTSPDGIWSDGTTIWVADSIDGKIYAYNTDGTRDSDKDFDTLSEAGNAIPDGIWSDGTTMWVADYFYDKIYAYRMSDTVRDSAKDFDTLSAAGNTDLSGIWSDGKTMWVADYADDKLYAYRMSDTVRDSAKDFDTLDAAGNTSPGGFWSDGTTMWVADYFYDKIYAYRKSDTVRDSAKDFDTLDAAGNTHPYGIWSDGTTMWVADYTDNKVYSYNMPESADATLSGLTVSPRNIIGFKADRTTYEVGVASTVTQATITATANHPGTTVAYSGTDLDSNTPGLQVNLSAGRNGVTVTVTATDTTTTKTYTVRVNRGVTDFYGWKAALDLDGLIAAGNDSPKGIWSDGTTMWVADYLGEKLYAYRHDVRQEPRQEPRQRQGLRHARRGGQQ